MKPSLTKNNPYAPYLLLLIQPIFMATNTIVARGGVESVPPISLAFWRWFTVFIILFPFFFNEILKYKKELNKEFFKLFFLGLMGCGICGAFPNLAGMTTTMANIGIIYTSSPVIIIFLSILFFKISLKKKGNNIMNTVNQRQNAKEIGGTDSTPPLATMVFVAIKIGWINKSK